MAFIKIKSNEIIGKIKPMNAVNNGPVKSRNGRENFKAYKTAAFSYARTHDASIFYGYGGEHIVDIHAVFPDFDKDPYDASSYDFELTDVYLENIIEAGTKVFYRLGSKIEHWKKKYGTLVPKDFNKWSVICEHIIRHYNEGWANGFYMNIEYWEIWNEPDLDPEEAKNKRTWGGSEKEFFELYTVAACHLKECFPALKIGGPALAYNLEWGERFLKAMSERNVPIDFFSWHLYTCEPDKLAKRANTVKNYLVKYGYENAQSILNEWNYVESFGEIVNSVRAIIGMKGAAFAASCMCGAQNSPVDMLMYYDARPSAFNGLFDFYTYERLKCYYVFAMFRQLYENKNQILCEADDDEIYVLGSVDANGAMSIMVSYFSMNDNAETKSVKLDIDMVSDIRLMCYILDEENDCVRLESCKTELDIKPNTVLLYTQKELDL